MEKKMMIVSVLAVLMIATSFTVNAEVIRSNGHDVPDEKDDGQILLSGIAVSGLFRVKVQLQAESSWLDGKHKMVVRYQFNDGGKIREECNIDSSTTTLKCSTLLSLRLPFWDPILKSSSGTVTVNVRILKEDPEAGPGWYEIVKEYPDEKGTFSGIILSW